MGIGLIEILKRLALIISHDYRNRNGTFRILWKSVARWRRLGWDGMLEWLDKEIWKIPNEQKKLQIDTRAYSRWIAKREPRFFNSYNGNLDIKFSIILAIKQIDESIAYFIRSVTGQFYSNWELFIVSDSCVANIWNDPRIVCITDKEATNREKQWNTGISYVSGEWIIFADTAMICSPYALSEMAFEIQRNPNSALIYTDDDTIDEKGNRSNPNFKSDFNPDLFYSMSYIGRSFGCKASTVDHLTGFNELLHGCSEYDFILRAWENAGEKAIRHIPKVLFHYQQIECNVTLQENCERQSLREHFNRIKKDVVVGSGLSPLTHRIQWPLPASSPLVSIIIPTRDQLEILQQCINSIRDKTTYSSYEIVIVDNQSESPDTLRYLERLSLLPDVKILKYNHTFNYSAINNYAVSYANGAVIVLLNNDVEIITPDWLEEMVSHASREEIGCVGAMLYYPDNTLQHAGVILGLGDVAGHLHKYMIRGSSGYFKRACCVQNFSAVTAACLAIRKEVYQEVGGLNEKNLTVAYNDVDLCLKVQEAGYRNLWTPYSELYHYESKSRGKDNTPEKKKRYLDEVAYMHARWNDTLKNDPYYHPMLTKTAEQFQLRRMD